LNTTLTAETIAKMKYAHQGGPLEWERTAWATAAKTIMPTVPIAPIAADITYGRGLGSDSDCRLAIESVYLACSEEPLSG